MLWTRATGAPNVHFCAPMAGPFGTPPCVFTRKARSFGLACRLVKVCRCRVCRGCLSGSSVSLLCLVSVSIFFLSLSLSHCMSAQAPLLPSGTVRRSWDDTEKISVAPAKG